jgi:hypothetical protein
MRRRQWRLRTRRKRPLSAQLDGQSGALERPEGAEASEIEGFRPIRLLRTEEAP